MWLGPLGKGQTPTVWGLGSVFERQSKAVVLRHGRQSASPATQSRHSSFADKHRTQDARALCEFWCIPCAKGCVNGCKQTLPRFMISGAIQGGEIYNAFPHLAEAAPQNGDQGRGGCGCNGVVH